MIVDIGLGEASRVAAVKAILERGLAPHVFVTGDVLRNLGLGPGAVLLQKPFGRQDIVGAIQRALGSPDDIAIDALVLGSID